MSIERNLLMMAQKIQDECMSHNNNCDDCPLVHTCIIPEPYTWKIPDPPPEPNKCQRIECQRIEWLRMLPDKEMVSVCAQRCEVCKYESRHGACEMFDCYDGMSEWWHNAVTLEQFRKDVGLK